MPPSPAGCSAEANLRAALLLLQALLQCGLRQLVLCPGSRSAPLAVAAGLLTPLQVITAIDERSAAFLGVGLGRASGRPVAVVTTSGTAVANLLPAVVEADSGAVPLLLLTADRPARLKRCGANQTVNQEEFLAPCCRATLAGDAAGLAAMAPAALEALALHAWRACQGAPLGPVHLNLPFEEPLHADAAAMALAAQLAEMPVRDPLSAPVPWAAPAQGLAPQLLDPDRPGVVVAGPWRGTAAELRPMAEALLRWQQRSGWPVLADGLSGLRGWPGLQLVHSYDLLLADGHGLGAAPQLLRLGPMPASRRLQQWIAAAGGPQLLISQHDPRNLDATASATARWSHGLETWLAALPPQTLAGEPSPSSLAWARRWHQLDQAAQSQLDQQLSLEQPCFGGGSLGEPLICEPALARALSVVLPPGLPLMLASSSPVRDWETFAAASAAHRPVFGFRGASGIDGTLSLAAGLALGCGELVLLTGDLALLHDANGWLWRRQLQARGVRLTVVLIDNGGGGIFEQLPIRAEGAPGGFDFERLFAMPQAVDPMALAAAYGVPGQTLNALEQLGDALAWARPQPMALLALRSDRGGDAQLRQQLRRRMARLSLQP
ncbi:MAG: 2-succinyl-5-enolpyruvyl-6-hydroxy-3-cyclohexene-1-carboxylic-acid synthase [Vulcanococcus sp.]